MARGVVFRGCGVGGGGGARGVGVVGFGCRGAASWIVDVAWSDAVAVDGCGAEGCVPKTDIDPKTNII
jgi:hypothetical protein